MTFFFGVDFASFLLKKIIGTSSPLADHILILWLENDHGQIGNQLEHHGLRGTDLLDWCANTGVLENMTVDRLPFRKEDGENGAFGVGKEFNLLALSCTKKAGGGSARNSICECLLKVVVIVVAAAYYYQLCRCSWYLLLL